jgi:amino-acid N-acetyltransferase
MLGIVTIHNPDRAMLMQITRLLDSVGLPAIGIEEMQVMAHFGEEGELIGILGVEDYGGDCLLRSLAVSPAHQHRGIGTALVTHLLAVSAGTNRRFYLYTEHAQRFMQRFGFETIGPAQVPDTIRSSPLIAGHCIERASAMMLALS